MSDTASSIERLELERKDFASADGTKSESEYQARIAVEWGISDVIKVMGGWRDPQQSVSLKDYGWSVF